MDTTINCNSCSQFDCRKHGSVTYHCDARDNMAPEVSTYFISDMCLIKHNIIIVLMFSER